MAKAEPRAIWRAAIAVPLLLVAGFFLQRAIASHATAAAGGAGPAVPTRAVADHMFIGYNGLAADIYWTEAIQYFGSRRIALSGHYPKLAPLLNLSYSLDPDLLPPAEYGAFFLADDPPAAAGEPQAAVALLRKAIAHHPDNWRLYFNLGFVYALNLHDRKAAAETFYAGSRVRHANPALAVLAADYFGQTDERQLARALWTDMWHNGPNADLRANALDHLQAMQVEDDLARLRQVASAYRARGGAWPASWDDLVRGGFLRGVPLDPQGHAYRLLPDGQFGLDARTKILALGKTGGRE